MAVVSRYTIALHILTLMARVAQKSKDSVTSNQIAASVNTNPVFIRRILALLRKAKLVSVRHGAGVGWSLAKSPDEITLRDVYEAVEQKPLFELHHSEPNPSCLIGQGIRFALQECYETAELAMKRELARVTISDLLEKTVSSVQNRDLSKLGQ
ncbi:Rrf2 family transcriptional regulator [Brevibacillus marinus]|uniref:Rrf2 family transcriptional regulator n=1 Tax=Brevibacillus marinus TaxID=2496837 RepID=UPI000F83B6FA|nr:Rrf2 family transcriptional regulator [Brevibacillus marinus]